MRELRERQHQVAVALKQESEEAGIRQQSLVNQKSPPRLSNKEESPFGSFGQALRGGFFFPIKFLDQVGGVALFKA